MTPFSRKEEIAVALGYRVSADGIVTSPRGKVLTPYLGKHCEYPSISIGRANGKVRVHRLQAFQLFGEEIYKPTIEVRHKDDDSKNFRADNLILGTHVQNSFDKPKAVRVRCATTASMAVAKWDHTQVLAKYRETRSYSKTMLAFGIRSKGTMSFIIRKSAATKPAQRDSELQKALQ